MKNPSFSDELKKQITDSKAKFIITSSASAANVLKAIQSLGDQVKVGELALNLFGK